MAARRSMSFFISVLIDYFEEPFLGNRFFDTLKDTWNKNKILH